jgi:hypothetical protein
MSHYSSPLHRLHTHVSVNECLKVILNDVIVDTFFTLQFTRGDSVDSRQRPLLPVKPHAGHLQGDEGSEASEERVRLLIALGYVAAGIFSTGNSVRNGKFRQLILL